MNGLIILSSSLRKAKFGLTMIIRLVWRWRSCEVKSLFINNLYSSLILEVYAKKNTSEKEHKHGWIYDLTRALSVVSRCVNVQKTFDMLHKANSAYLERQVNKGASVAISKRNCPYMTFLTLRLNPHVFHMPLNTTTFRFVFQISKTIENW